MDGAIKKNIAVRMATRALTGLYFIEDFLSEPIHSAKDGAYFRSLCILLSYSFELLLKAHFVMVSNFKSKADLEKTLQKMNHDIVEISRKIGRAKLGQIGVKSIRMRTTTNFVGYVVEMLNGRKIIIENFVDIRYDFIKDHVRDLPEDAEFREWKDESLAIHKKISEAF
jgi:hypothetical protein